MPARVDLGMPRRSVRNALAVAVSALSVAGALTAVLAPSAEASSAGGASTFCDAAGAPGTTHTVAIPGVAHVTVFTCGSANPPTFQQCSRRTIAVPGLAHLTVFDCVPPQASSPPEPPTLPF
jgi:hypothetical protein